MQDIADAVGVSRATVSNALRGKGRLSPETLSQIHAAAERLNYVPSRLGQALRTGKSRSFGLVIPDFRMPLFADFARAFASAADRRDMVLTVTDAMGSHEVQARHIAELMARGVDGLVVVPVRGTPVEALPVQSNLLVVDAQNNPRNAVSSDHFGGGALMAEHLLGLGHREILLLDSDITDDPRGASRVNDLRRAGFLARFEAAGVSVRRWSLPSRFETVRDAFAGFDPGALTAIAATYDVLALGAMHGLLARGIAVPDRVTVTGFDDTVWGQIIHPPLTTIRQDLAGLAETAFSIALGQTAAGVILPVQLVERGSTRPVAPSVALSQPQEAFHA